MNHLLTTRMEISEIASQSKEIHQWIVEKRRTIHRHPELMYEEFETSKLVQKTLKELNIPFQKDIAVTGVVGFLGNGKGPCIALRADMDALPIHEETDIDFKSEVDGKMHACGHDCHTAMLLGAARILKENEEYIDGTVKLIFQPAEEGGAGGKMMRDEGVLLNPDVQQIFGLHVAGQLPTGMMASREGTLLASAGSLSFSETLKILKIRGKAMQNSVQKGAGGMVAVLGSKIEIVEKIIEENKNKYECYIANDNSEGQLVLSGKMEDLETMMLDLKSLNIKNIKLPVSAPFHCRLMNKATHVMDEEISKLNFKEPKNVLISNVTGRKISNSNELKDLLIKQIESRVRWRESVLLMIDKGNTQFIEIGPGKVLSGLIKRIDKNVKVSAINTEEDIKLININE